MKGVLLAGGSGSRLGALTKVSNKHLLPVGHEPMIYHGIRKLVGACITDIMLITGTEHMGDFVSLLGSGCNLGCNLTYRVQDQAGGIAQALGLVEDFVGRDACVVLLGDNIFYDSLSDLMEDWVMSHKARVVYSRVDDPERFGVLRFEGVVGESRVIKIEEKPEYPPSDCAVTGIYMYPSCEYDKDLSPFGYIKELKPSERGEFEVTDLNNKYCERDSLDFVEMKGYWTDAGTHCSLFRANELVLDNEPKY
jgi:glucose-1-phosphate thymidylyltransferase